MGRRIAKHVYDDNWSLKQSTYYALDAQGNTMSVYEYVVKDKVVSFSQEEKHIYGSSRLGIMNESVYLLGSVLHEESMSSHSHVIGQRTYELSNHLGNVFAVVSDKLVPTKVNGSVVYVADLRQSTDYSPFGVALHGRNLKLTDPVTGSPVEKGRNGFQGQEMDNEIKGEGNSVNYTFRMHDPRLERFFAIDPLAPKYPYYTPYSFSGNRVISFSELEGKEENQATVLTDGDSPQVKVETFRTVLIRRMESVGIVMNYGFPPVVYSEMNANGRYAEGVIEINYDPTVGLVEGILTDDDWISVVRHEYQHFLDDMSGKLPVKLKEDGKSIANQFDVEMPIEFNLTDNELKAAQARWEEIISH